MKQGINNPSALSNSLVITGASCYLGDQKRLYSAKELPSTQKCFAGLKWHKGV